MAEQQGGYRRPSSPAPVSGPGALSRRTDGQGARYMSGGQYGEGQELMELQTAAPMSKAAPQPRARQPRPAREIVSEGMGVTPLFAPTERPNEPITAGAPFGPGDGPMAPLEQAQPIAPLAQTLQKLAAADQTGDAARLLAIVQRLGW